MSTKPVPLFDNESTDPSLRVELMTIAEVAEFLKISETSVRRLKERRLLPFIRVGRSIRFLKCDLLAYLEDMRVESVGKYNGSTKDKKFVVGRL